MAWIATAEFEAWALDILRSLIVDPEARIAAWSQSRAPWDTPDELALSFDDWFSVLRDRRGPGALDAPNEARFALLQRVDQLLDALNAAGDDIWSDESFRDHPLWRHVRSVASEAVAKWELH